MSVVPPRRVAIAIGVRDAERLAYLPGAVNGARGFHNWASAFGYESHLVTDEFEDVTFARLDAAFLAALAGPSPIHRLLLYFAGHGTIRDAEDGLWLLSKWYSELRAVGVEQLRRRLYLHDIDQLAIFADACRSLPRTIDVRDLAADPVLGRGPAPRRVPAIDRFTAAQDGSETFMIPGASPDDDRCLFSGVLLEGLWGTKTAAFSTVKAQAITSSSLGEYLRTEVPTVAQRYECDVVPSVTPAFPEHDNIYLGPNPPPPPAFPAWPLAGALQPAQSLLYRGVGKREPVDASAEPRAPSTLSTLSTLSPLHPPRSAASCAFAVEGAVVNAVWTPSEVFAERRGIWWLLRSHEGAMPWAAPTLIELSDGNVVAVTASRGSAFAIVCDARGSAALVYRSQSTDRPGDLMQTPSVLALARMEAGELRSDAALDLAVELRKTKHEDPVLGIVSAYLYESVGDIDSIRRMAWHYQAHGQEVPFDIALLADLDGQATDDAVTLEIPAVPVMEARTASEGEFPWVYAETPPAVGRVAGLWPTMRQGWTVLGESGARGALVAPGLAELGRHLTGARFTTFTAVGGAALANLFRLGRHAA